MNAKGSLQSNMAISLSIRHEIQRFESVHPSIYAIYDLIDAVLDPLLQHQIREHVVCIEDSFVNSQEWTLSREVPEIRLGVLGTCNSGKSSLVHRYLTGFYVPEESPEGGRFKKELSMNGDSNLLLIRDEGGPPEIQFTHWVDAVMFVFSLENEVSFNTIYSYYAKMCHYRNMQNVPIILVGTQDAISETNPRIINDVRVRKLTSDLRQCHYYEACATYGLNVDRVFEDACCHVLEKAAGQTHPYSTAAGQMASRSYHTQLSQLSQGSAGKEFDSMGSYASIPAVMSSCTNNANHFPQGSSPPFREAAPSGETETAPPPSQRPERRIKHQLSRDREKNIFQMSEKEQAMLMAATTELSRMSAPSNCQGHELVDTRDFTTPFSTPNLARKKISSSVQKSSSFSASGLQRHGSQLSLQIDLRELPSVRGSSGPKEKFKRIGDRIDLFFKEFQVPRDKAPLTPLLSRIPRHRSYSIQGKKDADDKKLKNDEPKGIGRVIPIKQGWLYKRSNKPLSKDWQKKYVTLLDDGRLTYHSSLHDYMENAHGKEIKLKHTTVKIPGQRPRGSEASLQQSSKQVNGQANRLSTDQKIVGAGQDQTVDAVVIPNSGLKREIDSLSLSASVSANSVNIGTKIETPNVKKKHRRMKSSSKNYDVSSLDGDSEGGYEFVIVSLDNKQWHFEASSPEEREEWILSIEQQIKSSLQLNTSTKGNDTFLAYKALAQNIRSVKGNNVCADCGAPNPDWASLNLGALICIECSGIHRNLGTHLSRVRSLELDEWP